MFLEKRDEMAWPQMIDQEILAARPAKNRLDPWIPYAFLVESERSRRGTLDEVLTLFLTNQECPFRCTMCDLWRNTLDQRVPLGPSPLRSIMRSNEPPLPDTLNCITREIFSMHRRFRQKITVKSSPEFAALKR